MLEAQDGLGASRPCGHGFKVGALAPASLPAPPLPPGTGLDGSSDAPALPHPVLSRCWSKYLGRPSTLFPWLTLGLRQPISILDSLPSSPKALPPPANSNQLPLPLLLPTPFLVPTPQSHQAPPTTQTPPLTTSGPTHLQAPAASGPAHLRPPQHQAQPTYWPRLAASGPTHLPAPPRSFRPRPGPHSPGSSRGPARTHGSSPGASSAWGGSRRTWAPPRPRGTRRSRSRCTGRARSRSGCSYTLDRQPHGE